MILSSAAMCLALNMFFEARGEPIGGQLMVAEVTYNRVASKNFPNNICDVVWQEKQFSWTHDGLSDNPLKMSYTDRQMWDHLKLLAYALENDESNRAVLLPNTGATYYHSTSIKGGWFKRNLTELGRVGDHIFYKEKE